MQRNNKNALGRSYKFQLFKALNERGKHFREAFYANNITHTNLSRLRLVSMEKEMFAT